MHQLLYRSRATKTFADQDLQLILDAARRNNPALGVTGLLLFSEGIFYQILEGRRKDVMYLFDKIFTDPRHNNIWLLKQQDVETRDFADWSMGFERRDHLTELPSAFFELSKDNLDERSANVASTEVMKFLGDFSKTLLPA